MKGTTALEFAEWYAFLQEYNLGHHVCYRPKTYESVDKPLPGRFNIVITAQPGWNAEGVIVASSLEESIEKPKAHIVKRYL